MKTFLHRILKNTLFCAMFIFIPLQTIKASEKPNLAKSEKDKKETEKRALDLLKNQTVEFMENKGQMKDVAKNPVPSVLFKAEAPGVDLYLTKTGLTYVFVDYKEVKDEDSEKEIGEKKAEETIVASCERMNMELVGAQIKPENIVKEEQGAAVWNYLEGAQAAQSVYNVHKYKKLTIKNVYPGIDWVLYNSSKHGFKYDFIVHPGAKASQIKMLYVSGNNMSINKNGALIVNALNGTLTENAPYSYLQNKQQAVSSKFKLLSQQKRGNAWHNLIGFYVPEQKKYSAETLVIDPQLVWSTYFGGTNYEGTMCADTDPNGNLYLCGYGASSDFPLLNPGASYFYTVTTSAFLVKFSNNGTLIWSTFLAGASSANYLSADGNGNLFVCGTAANAIFPTLNNNTYFQASTGGSIDAFITKFNTNGSIVWSTFYGGVSSEIGQAVATDASGNVYLVGTTTSTNFPVQNAGTYFEPTLTPGNCGYVVKFNNAGNRLWATYLKGINIPLVATDNNGNAYVCARTNTIIPLLNPGGTSYYQATTGGGGSDLGIAKFDNTGTLLWGTYYGGSFNEVVTGLEADKFGNLFVSGYTSSINFPTLNAGTFFQSNLNLSTSTATLAVPNDMFVIKFDNTATRKWATYLGGSRNDFCNEYDNLTIDTCGNVFVAFTTTSRNPPLQQACDGGMYDNDIDTSINANYQNVYLSRFSNTGNLMWSSYFGGDGNSFRTSLSADRFGAVFFSGEWTVATNTLTYPLVNAGGSSYFSGFVGYDDVYVAKFTNNPPAQTFSYSGGYCANDTARSVLYPPGFTTGGNFSAAPGLSINPVSGKIYPAASTPGTYTVNYHLPICYCPGASMANAGSATLSILPAPSVSVAGNKTICVGQKTTYTASGANSYTWSIGPITPTLAITPSNTAILVYTVTGKTGNNCTAKTVFTITVNKCTGLEDFNLGQSQIQIYPNPNQGEFTIKADKEMHLKITNELGQLVREIHLSAETGNELKIQGLAAGIYFISEQKSTNEATIKIIVTD
ncbi:MAG: SBBP repeat-containing protein [Bacteroidia bacterium]|nr:SBBP repeat-containing protein [Bacteroidia bacterium]